MRIVFLLFLKNNLFFLEAKLEAERKVTAEQKFVIASQEEDRQKLKLQTQQVGHRVLRRTFSAMLTSRKLNFSVFIANIQ